MKADRNALQIIGLFAAVFGVLFLLGNPISFARFPSNLSVYSAFGIILLLSGLVSFWYGTK